MIATSFFAGYAMGVPWKAPIETYAPPGIAMLASKPHGDDHQWNIDAQSFLGASDAAGWVCAFSAYQGNEALISLVPHLDPRLIPAVGIADVGRALPAGESESVIARIRPGAGGADIARIHRSTLRVVHADARRANSRTCAPISRSVFLVETSDRSPLVSLIEIPE